jgi:hypothetical protein
MSVFWIRKRERRIGADGRLIEGEVIDAKPAAE